MIRGSSSGDLLTKTATHPGSEGRPLDEEAVRELAALLKQRCGTGGTVKDGRIEIQGDQRKRLVAELENLGYRVKRTGG